VKKVNYYQKKCGEQAAQGQHKAENANPVADQGGKKFGTRGLRRIHKGKGSKSLLKEGMQPVTTLIIRGTEDTLLCHSVEHRLTGMPAFLRRARGSPWGW